MRADPMLRHSLKDWKERLRRLRGRYLRSVAAVSFFSLVLLLFPGLRWVGALLFGMSLAALLLPLIAFSFLMKKVRGVLQSLFPPPRPGQPENMINGVFRKHMGVFFEMPLGRLLNLLEARGSSVVLLATTIFLKKIRRASYDLLFADKSIDVYREMVDANNVLAQPEKIDVGRLWKDHIAMTAVYQLSSKNDEQLRKDLGSEPWEEATEVVSGGGQLLEEFLLPSETLRQVVDIATGMGTTLWFDANDQEKKCLESLLAAGQATMCFNLLRVSYRFGNSDDEWLGLRRKLAEDWRKFKEEPYWMYNEYIGLAGLEGFGPLR
jgi:hypothetical protein